VTVETLVVIFGGLLGAVLGSFLNVCIFRWTTDQSVVRPASHCPRCNYVLRWYDNVPVLSWLWLRGRCRQCRGPISIQYPLVELATAVIWAGFAWHFGPSLALVRDAVFFTILLGIAVGDARTYIIPDEFSVGGMVLGLLFSLPGGFPVIGASMFGAALGFGLLWLVAVVGKRVFKEDAMGGGDIKMMGMVGAFLGWSGVLLTVFLGAMVGVVAFLPALISGRRKLVPFGVFLAIGAAVTYLVGGAILEWYRVTAFGA
jgi:leader peptidase (prepilin peptidase)/N-methyltransferase